MKLDIDVFYFKRNVEALQTQLKNNNFWIISVKIS